MKKAFITIIASLLLITCAVGCGAAVEITPDTSWYTGHQSPYTITTAEGLAGLATIVNGTASGIQQDSFAGKTILIGSDIVINEPQKILDNANTLKRWSSIGNMSTGAVFAGTLDGQNHTITGLYSTEKGLFDYTENATIKNLTITDSSIKTNDIVIGMIAGFAGENMKLENCHVKNSIIESGSKNTGDVGGLAGLVVSGTVKGCSVSNSKIICDNCDYAGGLVGYLDSRCAFENCSVADCIVIAAKSGVGGIAGFSFTDVSFKNCSVKSTYVQSIYDNYTGGILGHGGAEVDIAGCTVEKSNIYGYKHSVGGIIGYSYHTNFIDTPSTVKDTIVISEVEEYVGGFVGSTNRDLSINIDNCAVVNCYISCSLDFVTSNVGPVIGKGKVSDDSKQVVLSNTIISNKRSALQTQKEQFNTSGVSADSDGWIVATNNTQTVNGTLYGTPLQEYDIPDLMSDLTTKDTPYTKSPFPVLGILAGLGVAAVFGLRMRR